jgi:hypothetical protein
MKTGTRRTILVGLMLALWWALSFFWGPTLIVGGIPIMGDPREFFVALFDIISAILLGLFVYINW